MQTVSPTEMFLVRCPASDRPVEPSVVEAHKDYLTALGGSLVLGAHAAPSAGAQGPDRHYIVRAGSSDEAKALVTDDPFAVAGGYASVNIIPLNVLIGSVIGGKAW